MLVLFCRQVLGTCRLIPAAQMNDISSTENGLILKTFSNCNPWISSGWCNWHWTNAGRKRNLYHRAGFGEVRDTGQFWGKIHTPRSAHVQEHNLRLVSWWADLWKGNHLKFFFASHDLYSFSFPPPFLSFYKSMQYYCSPKLETRGLWQYGLA